MKVNYRMAEHKDLEEIRKILNYYILHTNEIYDKTERSQEAMESWWMEKLAMGFPILVVSEVNKTAQKLIGFASYGIFRRWEGYSTTVEHSIYLDPAYRSKGVGKGLMSLLISQAEKQGIHSMIGGINSGNPASIKFHKYFGFKEVGRLSEVANKSGQWLELVLMQKIF